MADEPSAAVDETLVETVLRRLQPAPFWTWVGAELVSASPGEALIRIPMRHEFGRSAMTGEFSAHGGLVATALDMAASCALATLLAEGEGRATVDLNVHFLERVTGPVEVSATVRRRSKRTAVIDIELTSEGKISALGRAVFAIVPAR